MLGGWTVFDQVGDGFPTGWPRPTPRWVGVPAGATMQIGMDTPQVTEDLLREVVGGLDDHDAVLGTAPDGGLVGAGAARATRRSGARRRTDVVVGDRRPDARGAAGPWAGRRRRHPRLRDVDTVEDARAVAAEAPGGRFAAAWVALGTGDGVTAALTPELPFARVFTEALRGDDCHVVGLDEGPVPLPVGRWRSEADVVGSRPARPLRRAHPRRRAAGPAG